MGETKVDVSVLVPCYNTERYLDQALASAERNDRASIEIIVLNDGSTDGSLAIMRNHAARDPRVRVIDKANEGYGASMNRGIREARGTYVAILEPDDWVEPHMYDDLFEFAESFCLVVPPDVVKSSYWRVVDACTPQEHRLHCPYYGRITPPQQPFTLAECPRVVQHHPSIWSCLYRRGFLEECGIRFKEVPGAGWVDNPFLFETMGQAETIVYTDAPYYNYREDLPGSSSSNRVLGLSIERWNDMADVVDRLGITDAGVLHALGTIAFRYAGEAVGRGALEDDGLRSAMGHMFSRLSDETILGCENVSPQLRRLAFELSGREAPAISGIGYARGLIDEYLYSIRSNGVGFALFQTRRYLGRRKAQDKRSEAFVANETARGASHDN